MAQGTALKTYRKDEITQVTNTSKRFMKNGSDITSVN